MKAVSSLWLAPNTGATNISGFTGLPGGSRNDSGPFLDIGNGGFWWSSTQYSSANAWLRYLYYSSANVDRPNSTKRLGFSVRCVRD